MLLSAVSVLVVAQSSSEIPEGLMNNPVHTALHYPLLHHTLNYALYHVTMLQNAGKRHKLLVKGDDCKS